MEGPGSNEIIGQGVLGRVPQVVPKASSMGLCHVVTKFVNFYRLRHVVTKFVNFYRIPLSAKGTGSDAILGRGGGGSPG